MELSRALDQIDAIHGHLAKTEVYRGTRSVLVALTGVGALVGAWVQPHVVTDVAGLGFVKFWVGIALAGFAVVAGGSVGHYFFRAGPSQQRATRRVLEQFIPSLVAGVAMTAALAGPSPGHIRWLPGFWAILFGLGFFAARPYLPRAIGWVALFYLAAGTGLLLAAVSSLRAPWGMGLTFGLGQLGAALVLYWNLERKEHA